MHTFSLVLSASLIYNNYLKFVSGAGNSNPPAPAEDGFYANTNAAQFNIPIRQLEEYITDCQETISEHYGVGF